MAPAVPQTDARTRLKSRGETRRNPSDVDIPEIGAQAHFGWVTAAWRAVVAPNQYLFIGLLVVFEAVVGVLILSGGRRT
jgi:hypothetical protein